MKPESSKLIEAFKKGTHLQMKPLDDLALTVNSGDRDIEDYEAELKRDAEARALERPLLNVGIEARPCGAPAPAGAGNATERSLAPPAPRLDCGIAERVRGSNFKRCPQCGAATPKGKPCSRHLDHGEADRIMRKRRRKVLFRNGA
jgi:uncharacterized C2H2 Zn-finger protein